MTSRPSRRRQGVLRAAPAGTGIIAGGPMRAVFETLGVQDVVAKSLGTSNPYNMVRATFDALKQQDCPAPVAARRGKKVGDIVSRARRRRWRVARRAEGVRSDMSHEAARKPSRSSRSAARSAARAISARR